MYIIFDTETTGLPKNYNAPYTDVRNWPRMVQLAWQVYDRDGKLLDEKDLIIKPDGFIIPPESTKIHRIGNERANREGIPLEDALEQFDKAIAENKVLVAHNIKFDEKIIACEQYRGSRKITIYDCQHIDTMKGTINFCAVPAKRGKGFKFPSLAELHYKLFKQYFEDAHDALIDVQALAKCFFELQKVGVVGKAPEESQQSAAEMLSGLSVSYSANTSNGDEEKPFVNLSIHTYHSILEGAGSVKEYLELAKANNQPALAITDISTMSGTFELFQKADGIKPVYGIEFYVNDKLLKFDELRAQGGCYKLRMYAKNETGYHNLSRLLYLANTEGFGDFGRICPEWIQENSEGIIVTTTSIEGKVAELLQMGKITKAEEHIQWLLTTFGKENVYAEFQLTKDADQRTYNTFMVKAATTYGIKSILSNNTYFPRPEDWELQHVVSAMKQKAPIETARLKENSEMFFFNRGDFYRANKENGYNYPEWFIDKCLDRTLEIAERCNFEFETGVEKYPEYEPTQEVLDWCKSDDVEHIVAKIAHAKLKVKLKKNADLGYIELDDEKYQAYVDRLNYEIGVIRDKKMLDYFLVCWELVRDYEKTEYEGKPLSVGPGRGSAGGSLLSWCLDLIKVDPVRFDLCFERFLNPTRNSPPDLDIDFETGTDHISNEFLYNKYGRDRVVSVGTFYTFNEKGCLKDVARSIIGREATSSGSPVWKVTDEMPINKAGKWTNKEMPFEKWLIEYPKDPECSQITREFLQDPANARVLKYTVRLQGEIRGIGQHAAGVAITPDKCWKYFPTNVIPKKGEAPALVTAFQEADGSGKDLSALGILKLDRLKLETINVVEDCVHLIKETQGIDIRDTLYHLDLSDPNLYEEVRLGLNHGVFQFESAGMGSLIKSMKVDNFMELVACNALYRPGPMGIGAHDEFVRNKFNPEGIQYIHPSLEPILSKTNGVLVFQEQLMFIAESIGGMTLGDGDYLRRFMGNSGDLIQKELDGIPLTKEEVESYNFQSFKKYWGMFIDGAKRQGFSEVDVERLKKYLMKYLGYSFNLSHSLCYSYVACQTLYLKHYYPTEYYTCLLNHPKTSGKPEEIQAWISAAISSAISKGIKVNSPTRESNWDWKATGKGEITMGYSGIKGFGDVAYEELKSNLAAKETTFDQVDKFTFFDTVYSKFNKSAFTSLLKAGVFDDWSHSREELTDLFLKATKTKKKRKADPKQLGLFGATFKPQLKPNEDLYKPTTDLHKSVDFVDVCNCDLQYIEQATKVKSRISEKAGRDIESISDYVNEDFYYFIMEKKEIRKNIRGNDYLILTVSNGFSQSKLRIFGGDVKKVDPLMEEKGVYVGRFVKNDKGFINFAKMSIKGKKQIYLKKVDQI